MMEDISQSSFNYQGESVCELCQSFDAEDIFILKNTIMESKLHTHHSHNFESLAQVFRSKEVRESLRILFTFKYYSINEQCQHLELVKFIHDSLRTAPVVPVKEEPEVDYPQRILDVITQQYQIFQQTVDTFKALTKQLFLTHPSLSLQEEGVRSSIHKNTQKDEKLQEKYKILMKWFLDNIKNPYPPLSQRQQMAVETGLSIKQVQNWFTNIRKRYLEPLKKKRKQVLRQNSMKIHKKRISKNVQQTEENHDELIQLKTEDQPQQQQQPPPSTSIPTPTLLSNNQILKQEFVQPPPQPQIQIPFNPYMYYPMGQLPPMAHYPLQLNPYFLQMMWPYSMMQQNYFNQPR